MKGQGIFRHMAAMIGLASALEVRTIPKHYPDPILRAPYDHQRSGGYKGPRRVRKPLPCLPGTITFHDKLVRHFGRRGADRYGRMIQHKDNLGNQDQLHLLPTNQDFADNPPWAYLR